jgi:hypothetical protein
VEVDLVVLFLAALTRGLSNAFNFAQKYDPVTTIAGFENAIACKLRLIVK